MQQAVLQKFRAGGYNTIVATSIAEEGLDIMEVDLVICFDANVSPIRMIQRMGRTGRKRDGRVDILLFDVTVGLCFSVFW
jgi:Fanconi anemia group M protein